MELENQSKIQVIAPGENWWKFDWVEVWRYRHLIRFSAQRDLQLQYKQTILGPLHLLIRPFLMTFFFQLIFNKLGGMSTDGVQPFLFYFANNTLWAFYAGIFGSSSMVFRSSSGMLSKVYFPRIIPPLTTIITSGVSLVIQLIFLFGLYVFFIVKNGIPIPSFSSFLIIIPIVQVACIGFGVGLLFACVTLQYRDLSKISGVIIQGMMYLSPVIFPFALIPEKYQLLASFNPMCSAMESFRYFLFGEATLNAQLLTLGWGMTLGLLLIGGAVFNIRQRKFIDIV